MENQDKVELVGDLNDAINNTVTKEPRNGKYKNTGKPRRIKLSFLAKNRAEKKYLKMLKRLEQNIKSALDIEKTLQTKDLDAVERELFERQSQSYIDDISKKSKKMAKQAVKVIEKSGAFSESRKARRTDIYNDKAHAKRRPFALLTTRKGLNKMIRALNKHDKEKEKNFLESAQNVIQDRIQNIIGFNNQDELVYNEQGLKNLSRDNIINTVIKKPEAPNNSNGRTASNPTDAFAAMVKKTQEKREAPKPNPSIKPENDNITALVRLVEEMKNETKGAIDNLSKRIGEIEQKQNMNNSTSVNSQSQTHGFPTGSESLLDSLTYQPPTSGKRK